MESPESLHDYQRNAVTYLSQHPHAVLGADMGTGKTITTLTHIVNHGHKTLVVAPKQVAGSVWAEEAAKWSHTCHLRFSKILGTREQRARAMNVDADIYVINVDNIIWLITENRQWMADMDFDLLVLDELSLWKATGKRWKTLIKDRDKFPNRIGLTGTPAPNGLLDLFPQIQMIAPGTLGRTKTAYKQRYFYCMDPYGWKWQVRPWAPSVIYRKLADVMLRITNEELDMPALNVQRVPVELPSSTTKLMRELRHEGVIDVGDATVSAESAAVLAGKLMQLSNGAVYVDDEERRWEIVHDEKIKATKHIVEELQGSPAIIAYSYRHDLERLQLAYPDAPVISSDMSETELNEVITQWNAGEIPVMLGHPASMGHGLNLQQGGHHVIFFGLTWNLEHYEQLIARVYRQGQQSRHVFIHLLCAGAIDTRVADALIAKADVQQALLDFLKTNQES